MSAKNTNSHLRVRMLCEGAMMVALAQVLSYIKLMELPNGGSLTPRHVPHHPVCRPLGTDSGPHGRLHLRPLAAHF